MSSLEKEKDEEDFFHETEDDKAEALKLLSAWQSAMGSLSTRTSNNNNNSSSRKEQNEQEEIEYDLPLLAIDLDHFEIENNVHLIRMLWSMLHGKQQSLEDMTLSLEEEQRRSRMKGRSLLSPSSASSTPMAVLITRSSSSDSSFSRSVVELVSQSSPGHRNKNKDGNYVDDDAEATLLNHFCEVSEGFFGDQIAFHTSTHSLTVDSQAWARVKAKKLEKDHHHHHRPLRLAVFPYPSIKSVTSMWTTLTQSYEVEEDSDLSQKRAVAIDVLRGLIESSHRNISMKMLIWKEVQRIAQSAASTADAAAASSSSNLVVKDSDVSRSWQLRPTEEVASHPIVNLLVLLLDRTPFDLDENDDDNQESQQPREVSAAKVLHASAVMIASRRGVSVSSDIARWCWIAAPIAADCLDLFCSAFNGLTNIDSDSSTPNTDTYNTSNDEEYTSLSLKNTSRKKNDVEVPPPPLPRWDEHEAATAEAEEDEEVITAMKNGNFAVSFPKFKADNRLNHDALSDALLDKALGISVEEQNPVSPPPPPYSSSHLSAPEKMSFVRGSKGSSSRGMPQSTLRATR